MRIISMWRLKALLPLCVTAIVAASLLALEPKGQSVPTGGQAPRAAAPDDITARRSGVETIQSANRAVLDKYCVTCHNDRLKTGRLSLQSIDIEQIGGSAEVWEKVVQKVKAGAMPPAGRQRPDRATIDRLVSSLETALDHATLANPNPGQVRVHRLNRAEYFNAIRDLLALEVDARSLLPADDSSYGFDNIADALAISPTLLDRYMIAAQTIARLAVGNSSIRPIVQSYVVDAASRQALRMGEDLPFGTRGGAGIRHYFPADGEYTIQVRLVANITDVIVGIEEADELLILLDGESVKRVTVECNQDDALKESRPRRDSGENEDCLKGAVEANLEVRLPVKAGQHLVGATFVQKPLLREGFGPSQLPVSSFAYQLGAGAKARITNVEIGGPYGVVGPGDTPSRRQIFLCRPTNDGDEERCARMILSALARRAYRRPTTEADLQILLGFFQSGRRERDFDTGIQLVLERILVDPEFLFRVENRPSSRRAGDGGPTGSAQLKMRRISDLALGSRLAFFLWGSIPDDALVNIAARGKLSDPTVWAQQVRRMLSDDRSKALVTNFFEQWLFLRNVNDVEPDTKEFPDFDAELRDAFRQEAKLFLESQFRDDQSVLDLLRADYTFVNERLAKHYGIPNVYGSHFRRVKYPDERRRGILGKGGLMMAINFYPNRTSPVKRGVWLLNNVLGTPPPAPPPNVPAFPEEGNASHRTVRERLEGHRKNPACAVCHANIDPLGFALENFDAVGMWRDTDAGTPIDSSGSLPDGTRFNGPGELRELLLTRREEFVTTVTKNLLTYALGRGVEYYDMPAVRKIVKEAAAGDYRWSSLILAISESIPFQMTK